MYYDLAKIIRAIGAASAAIGSSKVTADAMAELAQEQSTSPVIDYGAQAMLILSGAKTR